MHLVTKLFHFLNKSQDQQTRRDVSVTLDGLHAESRTISISELDFVGLFTLSPNSKWLLAWSGHVDLHGERRGRYVLINAEEKRVTSSGAIAAPNSGAVVDDGTFILEDWHGGGRYLGGTLWVFDRDGEALIQRHFNANIYNSSLSADGRWAICQTANNKDHHDGSRLTAFDVKGGVELFSIEPSTGWADSYRFSQDGSRFTVVHDDTGSFDYDAKGRFLDVAKYQAARFESKSFVIVLTAVNELLRNRNVDAVRAEQALASVKRARRLGADRYPKWKAVAHKAEGALLEILGRQREALESYEAALRSDPKIRVKRRLGSLQKALEGNT